MFHIQIDCWFPTLLGATAGAPALFARNYSSGLTIGENATFSRASGDTVTDFEGVTKNCQANEARFFGARRIENLVPNSEKTTGWGIVQSGGATVTDNGDGTITFVCPVGGRAYLNYTSITGDFNGREYRGTVKVLSKTGASSNTVPIIFVKGTGGATSDNPASNEDYQEQRVSTLVRTSDGTSFFRVGLGTTTSLAGSETVIVTLSEMQLEEVNNQTNQNPGNYVSVGELTAPYHGTGVDGIKYLSTQNGNTVSDKVVSESTGSAITGDIGLLHQTTDGDSLTYSGVTTNNETRYVVDTTPPFTTFVNVDVDDVNLGAGLGQNGVIKSITVYAPGDRPA